MHTSGSYLRWAIESLSFYFEEMDGSGKYTESIIFDNVIAPATVEAVARVNMGSEAYVVNSFTISLVEDQKEYVLPPNVGQVLTIAEYDNDSHMLQEYMPRQKDQWRLGGWRIEGNMLVFPDDVDRAVDVRLDYVPTGDCSMHYSDTTGGGTLDATKSIFTLATTPDLGQKDRRPNAYAGMMLRIIDSTGIDEERIITSCDPANDTVTVRRPFTRDAGSNLAYEIVPCALMSLWQVVISSACVEFARANNATQKTLVSFMQRYSETLKTTRDTLNNMVARRGKTVDMATREAPAVKDFGGLWLGSYYL